MKKVVLYTDGACSFNPGPGGWGAILIFNNIKKEMSGGEPNTTNNRMELLAVIKGLSALKEKCEVHIYSDSAYIVNSFEKNWIDAWQKNNWKNANKKPVSNKDLWEELIELTQNHIVVWHKVKGHADNELNNRCDELATTEAKKFIITE